MKKIVLFAALVSLFTFARADIFVTSAHLSGAAEALPNDSPGTGFAIVTYDSTAHTLRVQVNFEGLTTNVTAAHIHATVVPPATTAGVATQTPTFSGFPSGVTSGTYDNTFDLMDPLSFNASFVTANGGVAAAETALAAALANGLSYLNIHTIAYPGGEIRGFLLVDSDADGVPDTDDAFPHSRDVGGNVTIDGCDTGVPSGLSPDGGTLTDLIYAVVDAAKNHGQFISGVTKLTNTLRKDSALTSEQAKAIQSCAAQSNLP